MPPKKIHVLHVRVVEGVDLVAASEQEPLDTFCVLSLDSVDEKHPKYKTQVVKGTVNPVWLSDGSFAFTDWKAILCVDVYTCLAGERGTLLGSIPLSISCLQEGVSKDLAPTNSKNVALRLRQEREGYYNMPENVVGIQKWYSLQDKKSSALLRGGMINLKLCVDYDPILPIAALKRTSLAFVPTDHLAFYRTPTFQRARSLSLSTFHGQGVAETLKVKLCNYPNFYPRSIT
jgi:hypothetical protein